MADTKIEPKKPSPDDPSAHTHRSGEGEQPPLSSRPEVDLSNRANQINPGRTPAGDLSPAASPVQGDHLVIPPAFDAKPQSPAKVTDTPQPTSAQPGMTPDTLSAAAKALKENIGDKNASEAILRSIPPQDKQRFEQVYGDQNRGQDLRTELKSRGYDASLLEPREEVRNAAWLKHNLDSLSHPTDSTTRALVEQSVRSNLKAMSEGERMALDAELKKNGSSLSDTIAKSRMSDASKQVAQIYAEKGSNLDAADLKHVAEIALTSRGSSEQKLMIVKEAFSGNTDAAKQARREFMGTDGSGEKKLQQTFHGDDLKQAMDYANLGKLHTATLIDLQRGRVGNNDKGVELAVDMMTAEEHKKFADGERLAHEGKSKGANPAESEALDYYQKVHKSLQDAAMVYTDPSRWFDRNRDQQVAQWEDKAAHGHETLISKIARSVDAGDIGDTMKNVIRNSTAEDKELMKDPTYRAKLMDLVGGANPSKADMASQPFGASVAREELARMFGDGKATAPESDAAHSTLKEVSGKWWDRFHQPQMFDALMHGKAKDFQALSDQEKQALEARLKIMPDGPRAAAESMLKSLKEGKDVQAGLPEQLYLDQLNGRSKQSVIDRLNGSQPAERSDPRVADAAKSALGSQEDFDKYAKPILEGQHTSPQGLREANWKSSGLFGLGSGKLDHERYYNGLKNLDPKDREHILQAAEKAKSDPESKKYLDTVFNGMSEDERKIALNVLKNPNQEYMLGDKIRTMAIGGNVDQKQLVDQFTHMDAGARLGAIQDYANSYGRFLPMELAKGADETTKKQLELSLPMNEKDLHRAYLDQIAGTGSGAYGHVAATEMSLAETQQTMRTNLLDKLPSDQRDKVRKEIDESFQKYAKALKDNDDAKDKYAKDLADKIMSATMMVGGVGMGALGANLTRLALTAATSAAARSGLEGYIKGGITGSDVASAAMMGTMDAMTFGRASAFKGALAPALERLGLSRVAQEGLASETEHFVAGKMTAEQLQQKVQSQLEQQGIANAKDKSEDAVAQALKAAADPRYEMTQAGMKEAQEQGKKKLEQQALDRIFDEAQKPEFRQRVAAFTNNLQEAKALYADGTGDVRATLQKLSEQPAGQEKGLAFIQKLLNDGKEQDARDKLKALLDGRQGHANTFQAIENGRANLAQIGSSQKTLDAVAPESSNNIREAVTAYQKNSDRIRLFVGRATKEDIDPTNVDQVRKFVERGEVNDGKAATGGRPSEFIKEIQNSQFLNTLPPEKRAAWEKTLGQLRQEFEGNWAKQAEIGSVGGKELFTATSAEQVKQQIDKLPRAMQEEARKFFAQNSASDGLYGLRAVETPDHHIRLIRFARSEKTGYVKGYMMEYDAAGKPAFVDKAGNPKELHLTWRTENGQTSLYDVKVGKTTKDFSNSLFHRGQPESEFSSNFNYQGTQWHSREEMVRQLGGLVTGLR